MTTVDSSAPAAPAAISDYQKGIAFCVLAHFVWGGMAWYFGLIRHISPAEIAIHRGLWSIPFAALVVWALGLFPDVWRLLRSPRTVLTLAFTSLLIAFNWGFYVWSIEAHRTLESSLGYFINPLMNVIMGFLFLGERFSRAQVLAIALAAVAVIIETISAGVFPWLGLTLGATFCLYGFIRKTIDAGPAQGFFIEVCLLAGPSIGLWYWLAQRGDATFGTAPFETLMLLGCGALTAAALLLFSTAIRRIPYSTAGLLQYISPSLVFLTAVFVFGEPVNGWKLLSFLLVWIALAVFTFAGIKANRAPAPV